MRKLLAVFLAVTVGLGMGLSVCGAGKPVTNAVHAKSTAKARGKPFRGHVKVVDLKAKIIVLEGAKAQTFQITSETAIKKDDKPATLTEVAVGDPVTGYAREVSDGKWEARSLYAGKHTPVGKN